MDAGGSGSGGAVNRRTVRLMRMTVPTDISADDPDYWGAFSGPFVVEDDRQIVDVDWSVHGEVTVTYLIPAT